MECKADTKRFLVNKKVNNNSSKKCSSLEEKNYISSKFEIVS